MRAVHPSAGPPAPAILHERATDLAVLAAQLPGSADRAGTITVVAGPAGIGKSSLLRAAADGWAARGALVLAVRGIELERDLSFGALRRLLDDALTGFPADRRGARPRAAVPAPLAALASDDVGPAIESADVVVRAFDRLLRSWGDHRTVALVVDDAHWLDAETADTIAFAARRLGGRRLAVLVATRNDDARPPDWVRLAHDEGGAVLRPRPLSPAATGRLTAEIVRGAEPLAAFTDACHRLTTGNPRLLVELLSACREQAIEADAAGLARLDRLVPERLADLTVSRISRLGPDAIALCDAVAVLERAPIDVAARLAELSVDRATAAAAVLVTADLLADHVPLQFAHPLTRTAVTERQRRPDRDRAHRRAARLLADRDPDAAALHLAHCAPADEPWAAACLRTAAALAAARGASGSAVKLLERAQAERATAAGQAELARALLRAGDPRGIGELRRARDASRDPVERANLAALLGQAQFVSSNPDDGGAAAALDTLRDGLAEAEASGDPRAPSDLVVTIAMIAIDDPPLRAAAIERARRPAGDPRLDAIAGFDGFCRGEPRETVIRRARSGLRTLTGGGVSLVVPTFHLAVWSLAGCDALDAADRAIADALEHADRQGSRMTAGLATMMRSWVRWLRGDIDGMDRDAARMLAFAADGWAFVAPNAHWLQAEAALARGRIPASERALTLGLEAAERTGWEVSASWLLYTRSALRLRTGAADAALADALEAGRLMVDRLTPNPAVLDWRGRAVRAALALGDHDRARGLADDGLTRAVRFGAPRALALAHRSAALCAQSPEQQIAMLRTAAAHAERCASPLVRASILLDLGSTCRRARQRAASRPWLRQAIELATAAGADALVATATSELEATGARRGPGPVWGAASLTPREREVAQLARDGLTNPAIARQLFVSTKTIESHLRSVYRKLGISARAGLGDALPDPTSASVADRER